MSTSEDDELVFPILDLSNNSSQLQPNLHQPRNMLFQQKHSITKVKQLLLRQNRMPSLSIYARAFTQFIDCLTEISLRENLFTEFPKELLILSNLTMISLAHNRIETIPENILPQLPKLLWLNLSNNRLSELPVDLVCCYRLRGIDLESNRFTSFPRVLFYMAHLEVLLIQKNQIKCLPPNHDFAPTLSALNLSFNQFTQIPTTLIHNPPDSITHLHLSGNNLRTLPPHFLSTGYDNLVSLDLHTCQLTYCTGSFFERLGRLKHLKRLNLAINRLTSLPNEIGKLNQIQWLNLNDNLLTHLPESMSNLTHLIKLGLVQNRLSHLPPFLFSHMLELQKLDIRRNLLKFMPPSILALAPRQEVDIHVDLATPYNVFSSVSGPSCPRNETCLSLHPYGGSLRTLLFYENPLMEHVDGILCDLASEPAQVLSIPRAYSFLLSTPHVLQRAAIRAIALENARHAVRCSRFVHQQEPTLMTDIDEGDHFPTDDGVAQEAYQALTEVPTLKEHCLRRHLDHRRRIHDTERQTFVRLSLPDNHVPALLQHDAADNAKQCDFCERWFLESRCQIGYLARMCNNRVQVPIRFQMCSLNCSLNAVVRLFRETEKWHTRQSLAHMDAAMSVPWSNTTASSETLSTASTSPISATTTERLGIRAMIRRRLSQLASSIFNRGQSVETTREPIIVGEPSIRPDSNLHLFRDSSQLRPLVFPNLQLARNTVLQPNQRPSRLVEDTERTHPHLRLATATPDPAVFNHLPIDALKLERF